MQSNNSVGLLFACCAKLIFATLIAISGAASEAHAKQLSTNKTIRVATYNTSLFDQVDGGVIRRLENNDLKARKIAAVIQTVRPDLILLNEFDYDAVGKAAELFQSRYLAVAQFGQKPIQYPYRFFAPVNTGVLSGFDLNHDGCKNSANDAFGFGQHAGQYGMLVLSKFPIDLTQTRTFQKFLWRDVPGASSPIDPKTGRAWYPTRVWNQLRLSSKSHWDVLIKTPNTDIHFLVSHPTPPVFDGKEDRNGVRNRDEIKFWAEYISPTSSMQVTDDQARKYRLDNKAHFVIAGDLNADPNDGDGLKPGISLLLNHPRIMSKKAPRSLGAEESSLKLAKGNLTHLGPANEDTGLFFEAVGNLRIDYVLPSLGLKLKQQQVFWPKQSDRQHQLIEATDHHMVWADLVLPKQ